MKPNRLTKPEGCTKATGFMLLELVVATAITLLIAGIVVMLIRHHVNMWREGKRNIDMQHEVQRLLKRMSNDFRRVNAPVVIDRKLNIWLGGEDLAEMEISPVALRDRDDDKKNGFEELVLRYFCYEPLGEPRVVRYYHCCESGGMVREFNGKKHVFSDKVTDLRFRGDEEDLKKIALRATVVIPPSGKSKERREVLEAVFRMKHDFIAVEKQE